MAETSFDAVAGSLNSNYTMIELNGATAGEVPANAKEVIYVVRYGTSAGLQSILINFVSPGPSHLPLDENTLSTSLYLSSSAYIVCQIKVLKTGSVNLHACTYNGTENRSYCKLYVYYK